MTPKEQYEIAQKRKEAWFHRWMDKPKGALYDEAIVQTSIYGDVPDDYFKVQFAARQTAGALLEEARQFLSFEQWERLRIVAQHVASETISASTEFSYIHRTDCCCAFLEE